MNTGEIKPAIIIAKIEVTHLAVPTVHYDFAFRGIYRAKNFSTDITASNIDEYCAVK